MPTLAAHETERLFTGLIFTLLAGPQKLPPCSVSANQSTCAVPTAREEVFCKATLRMPDLRLRLTPGLAPEALQGLLESRVCMLGAVPWNCLGLEVEVDSVCGEGSLE